MAFVLMGSLCVHFSMEPLKLLGALVGLGRKVKEQLPKKADEEDVLGKVPDSKATPESGSKEDREKKSSEKRWKFAWFEKEKEDDLLFGDASLQKEGGPVTQSETSSSKKTKPKAKQKVKDEPHPEEPVEPPEPIDDESSPNEKERRGAQVLKRISTRRMRRMRAWMVLKSCGRPKPKKRPICFRAKRRLPFSYARSSHGSPRSGVKRRRRSYA